MPLDVVRLVDSDLFAKSTGNEFKAAVALWCKSWLQIPAASLPDDDRVLAHLSGTGTAWKKCKAMALRGWTRCSDGRLYHPVVAEKARKAWEARLDQRERAAKRWSKPPASHLPIGGIAVADAMAMQGIGIGKGTGREIEGRKEEGPAAQSLSSEDDAGELLHPSLNLGQTASVTRLKTKTSDDVTEAVRLWNAMAAHADLPQVSKLTEPRRRSLLARLREAGGIEGWKDALRKVAASEHLTGVNNRGWKPSSPWDRMCGVVNFGSVSPTCGLTVVGARRHRKCTYLAALACGSARIDLTSEGNKPAACHWHNSDDGSKWKLATRLPRAGLHFGVKRGRALVLLVVGIRLPFTVLMSRQWRMNG